MPVGAARGLGFGDGLPFALPFGVGKIGNGGGPHVGAGIGAGVGGGPACAAGGSPAEAGDGTVRYGGTAVDAATGAGCPAGGGAGEWPRDARVSTVRGTSGASSGTGSGGVRQSAQTVGSCSPGRSAGARSDGEIVAATARMVTAAAAIGPATSRNRTPDPSRCLP